MKFYLVPAILLLSISVWSQPDTAKLKMQVENIHTIKNHVDFWEFIFERDQNMRNNNQSGLIDIENLILVSDYLNRFGYPDINVLGEKATISKMVWVHNKYDEIKKETFPIILMGYSNKTISEFNLRDYYLRILYQRYYDDHGNRTKPLSQIYKELEPNLTNQISIRKVYQTYMDLEKYFSQDKVSLGIWATEDTPYQGDINGSPVSYTLDGAKVTIYKMPDGKYYLASLYDKQSSEPQEISPLDDQHLTFKLRQKQTNKVYQIAANGDLIYQDESGKKINVYHLLSKK